MPPIYQIEHLRFFLERNACSANTHLSHSLCRGYFQWEKLILNPGKVEVRHRCRTHAPAKIVIIKGCFFPKLTEFPTVTLDLTIYKSFVGKEFKKKTTKKRLLHIFIYLLSYPLQNIEENIRKPCISLQKWRQMLKM